MTTDGAIGEGWDAAQYLKFAGPRLRPAIDLLARLNHPSPSVVYDLGCGAGNVTGLLRDRWPEAALTGIDFSEAMLSRARTDAGAGAGAEQGEAENINWVCADLNHWSAPVAADVLFSNAALHWLDNHKALFPRLMASLAPGGVLAVQMPKNYSEPSHRALAEVVKGGAWASRLGPLLRQNPVAEPDEYIDILSPLSAKVEVWETVYTDELEGDDAVLEWTRGTVLKPILDALTPDEAATFTEQYGARLRDAYPPGANGRTLFPFRRIFIIAKV